MRGRRRGRRRRSGSFSSSVSSSSLSSSGGADRGKGIPRRSPRDKRERAFSDKVRQAVKLGLMPHYRREGTAASGGADGSSPPPTLANASAASLSGPSLSREDFKRLAREVTDRFVREHWAAALAGDGLYHRSTHGAMVKEAVRGALVAGVRR
jgi:hypothetical protein